MRGWHSFKPLNKACAPVQLPFHSRSMTPETWIIFEMTLPMYIWYKHTCFSSLGTTYFQYFSNPDGGYWYTNALGAPAGWPGASQPGSNNPTTSFVSHPSKISLVSELDSSTDISIRDNDSVLVIGDMDYCRGEYTETVHLSPSNHPPPGQKPPIVPQWMMVKMHRLQYS